MSISFLNENRAVRGPALAAERFVTPGALAGLGLLALAMLGPIMTKRVGAEGEGNWLRQVLYFGVFLLAIVGRRPLENPARLLVLPISITVALAWCWLSLTWALEPSIALRRLLLTSIVIWTTFLVVRDIRYERMMTAIRIVLVVTLIANYVAVLGWPAVGIHQADELLDPGLTGNWRGILVHKNFTGAVCAFTVIAFVFDARSIKPAIRILVLAATGYLLARSQSKTSMGVLAVSLVLGWLYLRYDPRFRTLLLPVIALVGSTAALLSQSYWGVLIEPFTSRGGFTGRTQIWPVLLAYAHDHLWLGTGYGSFWNIGPGNGPLFTYATGWVTRITQGHNGYLDLLVGVGLPGLALAVLAVIVMPIGTLLASRSAPRQPAALLIAMLLFCAGHNATESSLFDRDTIVQTFLVIAAALAASISKPRARSREQNLEAPSLERVR